MKQPMNAKLNARINRFMDRKLAQLNGPAKLDARPAKSTARTNGTLSVDYIAL